MNCQAKGAKNMITKSNEKELEKIIKEEKRRYSQEWRDKNREHLREYHRNWRKNNKEKLSEQSREYWLRKARQRAENQSKTKEV